MLSEFPGPDVQFEGAELIKARLRNRPCHSVNRAYHRTTLMVSINSVTIRRRTENRLSRIEVAEPTGQTRLQPRNRRGGGRHGNRARWSAVGGGCLTRMGTVRTGNSGCLHER